VTVTFPVCLHHFLNQQYILRISLGPIYRHLGSTPNHLKKLQPRFHELHYLDHPGRRDPMVASVGSSVRGFLLFGILDEGFVLATLSGRPPGWAPSVNEGRDHRVQGAATVTVWRLVRGGWTMLSAQRPLGKCWRRKGRTNVKSLVLRLRPRRKRGLTNEEHQLQI
jgi:hypothetical protein